MQSQNTWPDHPLEGAARTGDRLNHPMSGCAAFFFRMPENKEVFFMSKNTKTGILATIVLVILIIAALVVWKSTRAEPEAGSKTVTLTITHMDGTEKTVTLKTDAEYFLPALQEQNLIDGYDSEFGYTITTVDGEFADANLGQWWVFTKGGEWVDTDVSTTVIYDGDGFEFYVYQ